MHNLQPQCGLQSGLPLLEVEDRGGSTGAAVLSSGQVWAGDARSCALSPRSPVPGSAGQQAQLLAVGAEPADVLTSADGGDSWLGADGFRSLPSRDSWTFPPSPHQPHTLSIEMLSSPVRPTHADQSCALLI